MKTDTSGKSYGRNFSSKETFTTSFESDVSVADSNVFDFDRVLANGGEPFVVDETDEEEIPSVAYGMVVTENPDVPPFSG